MAQTFKTGDVVQLKSGGPKMTVKGSKTVTPYTSEISPNETQVVCTFFNDKLEEKNGTFEQDMLEVSK